MVSGLIVVLVFGALIFIHEFGHFIVAKKCGVRVEIFSLGFGPKLFGVKKGDTEYKISLVPLGGYVKLAGETEQDGVTGAEYEFLSKPPGQRFKVLISGALFNYIVGFLILYIFGQLCFQN